MPKGIPRNQTVEQKILHRFKIAQGHLARVVGMVESGHYCIDVIHQSLAVQAALKSADEALLQNHMETCVTEEIRKGNTEEAIAEIMKIMEKK